MAGRPTKRVLKPRSRAYVREWMEAVGLIQADLVNKLGWSKAKANSVWHGEQRYNEDIVDEVSELLNIQTFELLMHPAVAMKYRNVMTALEGVAREVEKPAAEPVSFLPAGRKRA